MVIPSAEASRLAHRGFKHVGFTQAPCRSADDYKRLKENWQRLFQEKVGLARIKPIIENRAFLQKLMMAYYSQHDDGASIYWIEEAGIVCPLLSQRTWIPDHLWDLDKIALRWDDAAPPAKPLWQGLAQKLRNECNITIQNNLTYRLTNVQASDKGITAMFNNGWYEEYIETCEALTWELGQALLSTSGKSAEKRLTSQKILDEIKPHLSRRTSVSPFDMHSRSMTPGINTLTVVVTPKLNTITFLMHHRGGGKGKGLAEAIGTWHIAKAHLDHRPCKSLQRKRHQRIATLSPRSRFALRAQFPRERQVHKSRL